MWGGRAARAVRSPMIIVTQKSAQSLLPPSPPPPKRRAAAAVAFVVAVVVAAAAVRLLFARPRVSRSQSDALAARSARPGRRPQVQKRPR